MQISAENLVTVGAFMVGGVAAVLAFGGRLDVWARRRQRWQLVVVVVIGILLLALVALTD